MSKELKRLKARIKRQASGDAGAPIPYKRDGYKVIVGRTMPSHRVGSTMTLEKLCFGGVR